MGSSEILDDYLVNLKNDLDYREKIKHDYDAGKVEETLSNHYGQYLLLKDMFRVSICFSHGNNKDGRPWSNSTITSIEYGKNIKGECRIFCRIDKKFAKNKNGYYASFRQYVDERPETKEEQDRKTEMFNMLKLYFEQACKNLGFEEKNIKYYLGGKRAGYKESEFGYF